MKMDTHEVEKKIAAYKGKKVALVVTGGGQGIAQLSTIPGASKVLHSILIPYSYEESGKFIAEKLGPEKGAAYQEKAVSQNSAMLLNLAGQLRWSGYRVITCSAATTTIRWRRGENQAFISVGGPGIEGTKDYHLKLSKLTEEDYHLMGSDYIAWKRRSEDRQITEFILKLIFGAN